MSSFALPEQQRTQVNKRCECRLHLLRRDLVFDNIYIPSGEFYEYRAFDIDTGRPVHGCSRQSPIRQMVCFRDEAVSTNQHIDSYHRRQSIGAIVAFPIRLYGDT